MRAFLRDKCNIELVSIAIGETIFDDFQLVFPERFTIETFYRILAPYNAGVLLVFQGELIRGRKEDK